MNGRPIAVIAGSTVVDRYRVFRQQLFLTPEFFMFARISKLGLIVATAALLPFATLRAQTFNFNFRTDGVVSNGATPDSIIINHGIVSIPMGGSNPFNVTSQISRQCNGTPCNPTGPSGPTTIPIGGTFTWFTTPGNDIVGTYLGSVNAQFDGSMPPNLIGIDFANQPFTIIGGTGIYTNLRGSGFTAGSGDFANPMAQPTSNITWVGSASVVPEPSTVALTAGGLGALLVVSARRRRV